MTTEAIQAEVTLQVERLRSEGRWPAEIRIDPVFKPAIWDDAEFIHNIPGRGFFLRIMSITARPGEITVLPKDWGGYGQGLVRPA